MIGLVIQLCVAMVVVTVRLAFLAIRLMVVGVAALAAIVAAAVSDRGRV